MVRSGKSLADAVALPEERAVSESVEALVHEHARMVFKIAYSVLRHHADAEDVAQEVFLRVLAPRERTGERSKSESVDGEDCMADGCRSCEASRATAGRRHECNREIWESIGSAWMIRWQNSNVWNCCGR